MSESKPSTAVGTTSATTDTTDVQKLQRAIVDGLEDVKGQEIVVFNTEHLSPLFERVIIASGTSNRQTKALAMSVSEAVREAGFPKPRIEGEANGEWIIVDCGAAVAHVMQPNIRVYYNLEEIWGGKVVHLKSAVAGKTAAGAGAKPAAKKAAAKKVAVKTTKAQAAPTKTITPKVARKTMSKAGTDASADGGAQAKPATKTTTARKTAAKPAAKPAVKPATAPAAKKAAAKSAGTAAAPVKIQKLIVGKPSVKPAAKKATGTRAGTTKAPVARKAPARKSAG